MKKILFVILFIAAAFAPVEAASQANSHRHLPAIGQTDAPKVAVSNGSIVITAPAEANYVFDIYSITGQLVKRVKLTDGTATVELPQGCYIVKCERWSKKVVVN